MDKEILKKIKKIQILAMDFDGVHTDGFVYVGQNGEEFVRCSRRDSLGLNMLQEAGIKLFVISKEKNPVVKMRCEKLGILYYQGVDDSQGKAEILKSLAEKEKVDMSRVAFIGDDENDIDALSCAGVSITVADGHEKVKKVVNFILTRKGGDHALRELSDLIMNARNNEE